MLLAVATSIQGLRRTPATHRSGTPDHTCATSYRFTVAIVALALTIAFAYPDASAQLPQIIDLGVPPGTEASPTTRVFGGAENGQLGNSYSNGVAYGDFDGDGFDDVVVGAGALNQFRGSAYLEGEVYVFLGKDMTAPIIINLAESPGDNGECRILGDDTLESFGAAIATGDFNGDGFDDAIIGAPSSENGAGTTVGAVCVVYGHPGFGDTEIVLQSPPGSSGETRIVGDDANDYFGRWVAAGDVNGDGFDDIVAGAPFADQGFFGDAGETIIVYGSATRPGTTIDLSNPAGSQGETRILGRHDFGRCGLAVGTGDLNGDGFDDVLAAAPLSSFAGKSFAGIVYLLFGREDLPGATIDLESADGTYGEIRIRADEQADELGHSVAVGDVNGDGFDDAILGARHAGPSNSGVTYIIYGSTSMPGPLLDLSAPEGAHGETRIIGDDGDDHSGSGVASGDVNGDGLDDIIIGAPDAELTGTSREGEAYVVYGSTLLAGRSILLDAGEEDVRVVGSAPVDLLGIGVGAGGDMDRDGVADFAVTSCHGINPLPGAVGYREGYAALVFGDSIVPAATAVESFRTGLAPTRGLGGRLSPTLRMSVSFPDGTSGTVTATLNRDVGAIAGFPEPAHLANVAWATSSTRLNWSSAHIVFQYTDDEIVGLVEDDLKLYHATSPSGPWVEVQIQSLDTQRNEITAAVTGFGVFVLADKGTPELPLAVAPVVALLLVAIGAWRMGRAGVRRPLPPGGQIPAA